MAKLPQGWVECQLGEVFDIRDGTHDSPKYLDIGYPLVTSKNLKNGLIDLENVSLISEKDYNKINERSKVSIGDILFAMIGTIGNPVIVDKEPQFAIKNVALFKYNNLINNKYLKYFLEFRKTLNIMHSQAKGSTQKFVGLGYLRAFIFPVCPLNEQRRIVEKIESEFAKINEGLEHLQKAKEEIKQYRQSVLKSAFEGKLYKTSEWKEITLGEVVEPRRERITPTDKNGNMVYIGMDCIEPNSLYIHKQYKLKETKSVAFVFYKNDVLYGRMRSYLNKVWEATCNGTASAEFIVFPENDNIFSSYLKYLLHQQNFVKYATRNASGDRPRVKFESDLAGYKFRLPSIEEQKKIVEEIEKRFAVAEEVEKVVEQNIEKAKQLKQSILKKAFEGRLVPQDPTDEPASILLEKIKKERSKKC